MQELSEDEEWEYTEDWSTFLNGQGRPYKHHEYFSSFIDNFMLNPGNAADALRMAGFPETKTIYTTANRMYELLKPFIMERFEDHKKKFALLGHKVIVDVMEDDDAPHREKLQAGKLLMDYGGHAPAQRVEVDMTVDISDVRAKALERMNVIDGEIEKDNGMVEIDREELLKLLELKERVDGEVQ